MLQWREVFIISLRESSSISPLFCRNVSFVSRRNLLSRLSFSCLCQCNVFVAVVSGILDWCAAPFHVFLRQLGHLISLRTAFAWFDLGLPWLYFASADLKKNHVRQCHYIKSVYSLRPLKWWSVEIENKQKHVKKRRRRGFNFFFFLGAEMRSYLLFLVIRGVNLKRKKIA